MQENNRYVIKIDRGYIHYSDRLNGITEYGTTFFMEDAKKFSGAQADRIIKTIKKNGEKAVKILIINNMRAK